MVTHGEPTWNVTIARSENREHHKSYLDMRENSFDILLRLLREVTQRYVKEKSGRWLYALQVLLKMIRVHLYEIVRRNIDRGQVNRSTTSHVWTDRLT